MSTAWWTVARREITVKIHDKAFLFSFAMMIAIIVAAIGVPLVMASKTPSYTLVVVGQPAEKVGDYAAAVGKALLTKSEGGPAGQLLPGSASGANIALVKVDSVAAADALLADRNNTATLTGESLTALTLTARDDMPTKLSSLVTEASKQLQAESLAQQAQLSPSQMQAILSPIPPAVKLQTSNAEGKLVGMVAGLLIAFLFYFSILTFGIAIAQSVVEEKQSRVVEILVAAMPVRTLLTGKIVGSLLLALAQLVVFVSLGVAGAYLLGFGAILGTITAGAIWFVAFFLAGFIMLACLWAAAGSLASRYEDLGSTTGAMQILVMAPFLIAIMVKDHMWLQIFSYIPFTAPLVMPIRVVSGQAAFWEPIVSILIVAVTAALLIVLGSKLYSASIMHTSSRLTIRGAIKNARLAAQEARA